MSANNRGGESVVCCECGTRGVRPWREESVPLAGHGAHFTPVRKVYSAVMVDQGVEVGA